MSIEQRFTAAVNVIRGLPKNGNYIFSSPYLKISFFIHYLINNPESKVVFVNNKGKSENNESVMLSILNLCYVRLPNYVLFINIKI